MEFADSVGAGAGGCDVAEFGAGVGVEADGAFVEDAELLAAVSGAFDVAAGDVVAGSEAVCGETPDFGEL